jgi:hypothetical protein
MQPVVVARGTGVGEVVAAGRATAKRRSGLWFGEDDAVVKVRPHHERVCYCGGATQLSRVRPGRRDTA